MAAHQLQAMQGTGFLLLHRQGQCWEYLDRLSWRTESKHFSNQGYSHSTTLWRERLGNWSCGSTADGPCRAAHTDPLQWGKEKTTSFPLTETPCSSFVCFSGCTLVSCKTLNQNHIRNFHLIKKAFAGPNWTTGKRKTPNKEVTGKGVYISPFSGDRWISLTGWFFIFLI